MENELWKDVPGYEGLYQASNMGRIKSLKREGTTGKYLKCFVNNQNGYVYVTLSKNNRSKTYSMHRLVWITFVGSIPEGMQINHLSEDKTDCSLSNLSLVTPKENSNWGTRNKRIAKKEENRPDASKPIMQFDLNNNLIKDDWTSQGEIQRTLGFKQQNISACCRGLIPTYKGYIWRYKEC